MADEALITQAGGDDLIPRPDPTALTATAVRQAKEDLRRELSAQRELIDQRINGIASELRSLGESVQRMPEDRDDLRRRLQADIATAVSNLRELHAERFTAVQQQFTERDVRGEQEKKSSKEALDAALLAQKESVSQQNDANTTAATKTETNFTKQIDLVGTQITALDKSLTDRISELKERIDRGEGTSQGATGQRAETRAGTASVYALIGVVVAVAAIIVTILLATGH
jgi:uncharacterized coiled-coil DUF342 family protein